MAQTPHGPANLICPMHRAKMSKVCHTCPWWMSIKGKNPQTGQDVDDWNCAIAWGPVLAVNMAREMNSMSTEVNVMRNETAKAHTEHMTMASVAVQRASQAVDDTIGKYAAISNHVPALPAIEAAE